MKTLFGKLLISFGVIILFMIVSVLASFYLVYSKSYEEQIIAENSRQTLFVARSLQSFINSAYKEVENLSFNSDVISMNTERQTPVFVSTIKRNDYFELLYAQGMDGMQTGRSSGNLGNRKERWWFVQMEQIKKPFVSESYYSVGTNMPCASVFYPIMIGTEMIGIMAGDIKLSALHDMVAETADADSYSFILDGKGVVVAHPDKTFQEELYNYAKLTKTVTLKDAAGKPMQNAQGNLTEEQNLIVPQTYKAVITDMMRGNTNSAKFKEEDKFIYLSYRPVIMNGSSDPWYVLSVRDEAAAMRTKNTVILVILCSSGVVILAAFVLVFFIARNVSSPVEKLETLCMTDELTKLNNRRSFLEYMNTMWALSRRLQTTVNVLMIDVDNFKKYNDSMGHLEGDKALIAIAQCMKSQIKRESDFVARFGGEEFVCLVPFLEKDDALNLAKKIVQKIESMKIPHPMSGCSKYVTVSIGLASATPDDHNSQIQLLDKADKALYTAKQSGKNRVETE